MLNAALSRFMFFKPRILYGKKEMWLLSSLIWARGAPQNTSTSYEQSMERTNKHRVEVKEALGQTKAQWQRWWRRRLQASEAKLLGCGVVDQGGGVSG